MNEASKLTLLLADSLTRQDDSAFYFSDLREEIDRLAAFSTEVLHGLELLRPSELYVRLLQLENEGLLQEVDGGHVLTTMGRREARKLRRDHPSLSEALDAQVMA